jgi:hypothetical protein
VLAVEHCFAVKVAAKEVEPPLQEVFHYSSARVRAYCSSSLPNLPSTPDVLELDVKAKRQGLRSVVEMDLVGNQCQTSSPLDYWVGLVQVVREAAD